MISIGKCVLEPSYSREPHYKGGFRAGHESAPFSWDCVSCKVPVSIDLSGLNMYSSLELSAADEQLIKERFQIGVAGRSKDGGWPCFHRVVCSNCNQAHLVYIGVQEPYNSIVLVTVQAVCGLNEEPEA